MHLTLSITETNRNLYLYIQTLDNYSAGKLNISSLDNISKKSLKVVIFINKSKDHLSRIELANQISKKLLMYLYEMGLLNSIFWISNDPKFRNNELYKIFLQYLSNNNIQIKYKK
tara:strand:+ start:660 stop:1004 length:345 start_codon:yes stop_codon:yes gene_type:complete